MSAERHPVVGPDTPAPSKASGPGGKPVTMSARIRIVRDQLKIAEIESEEGRHFEFYCDEPSSIGGKDEAPQPLSYVAAGIGF